MAENEQAKEQTHLTGIMKELSGAES
ncbi:superfamily I DNA and RNA helicase, partial [Lacticaseibacillus paracasei subsp. paracasei Lpp48]